MDIALQSWAVSRSAAAPHDDAVLLALSGLVDALRENIASNEEAVARAQSAIEQRRSGADYRTIVERSDEPLLIELVTGNTRRLMIHGARLRRALAAALHEEGLTMEQIATLFGVTRQRISAILREAGTEA